MRGFTLSLGLIGSLSLPSPGLAEAAIAFSQEAFGGWWGGWSYNRPTDVAAFDDAMSSCRQQGSNCQVIVQFSDSCVALAVQTRGNGWAARLNSSASAAQGEAMRACKAMGRSCEVKATFCDTVTEVLRTLICTEPVYAEEHRLMMTIDGTEERTASVTRSINYLREKYCREIEGVPDPDHSDHVSDNCFQYTGLYRGERVYWSECHE